MTNRVVTSSIVWTSEYPAVLIIFHPAFTIHDFLVKRKAQNGFPWVPAVWNSRGIALFFPLPPLFLVPIEIATSGSCVGKSDRGTKAKPAYLYPTFWKAVEVRPSSQGNSLRSLKLFSL
jgi:hypothetical protein